MHNTKEYLHTFKAGLCEQSHASIILFSRIKSFPRNLLEILEKFFERLETRFSIFENFEDRESSFKSRQY